MMHLHIAAWVILPFICGSTTGKIIFNNEVDLTDLMASLPQDVVNQAKLILEDPRKFVDFFLSTNRRPREKRSTGKFFPFTLETLDATIDISLTSEERPLEGFEADISIGRLQQLLEIEYERANFNVTYNGEHLKVIYRFYQYFSEKESGTITFDFISETFSNIREGNTVNPLIPEFSFKVNPDEEPLEVYKNKWRKEYENKKKKRKERNELKANKNTLMKGNFTLDDDNYSIKLGKYGNMSERRYNNEEYKEMISLINFEYEVIIFNLADRTFHDIVIGYKWDEEHKQAQAMMLNGNTRERTSVRTKLENDNFKFTVKDDKDLKLIETRFYTKYKNNGWDIIAHHKIGQDKLVYLNMEKTINDYRNEFTFYFKFAPEHLKPLCPVFRVCSQYEIKAKALLDINDSKKVEISANFLRDTDNLMSMKIDTTSTPYIFNTNLNGYLSGILPQFLNNFELEIQEENPGSFTISKSSLEDLKTWTAVAVGDTSWKLFHNNEEACTLDVTQKSNGIDISTVLPDRFNTKILTLIKWHDHDDFTNQNITFDTISKQRNSSSSVAWNIAGLEDILFEIKGNGNSAKEKFGHFLTHRQLKINPSKGKHYIFFNSKEEYFFLKENPSFSFDQDDRVVLRRNKKEFKDEKQYKLELTKKPFEIIQG